MRRWERCAASERFGLEGELQRDARQVCVDHKGESETFYLKLGARRNDRGWLVWDDFLRILPPG